MEHINVEQLISEVQEREPLWNPANAGYKNLIVQKRLWNEVGTSMGVDVDMLQQKWQNLRSQYAREKRITKLPTGSTAMGSKVGISRYYQNLEFLAASYSSRPCVSNIPAAVEVVEEDSAQDTTECLFDVEDMDHHQPLASRQLGPTKIQKQLRDLIELENRKISNIEEIRKSASIDPFALSMSNDLKKLSFVRQLQAKTEILEVLMKHAVEEKEEEEASMVKRGRFS